MGLFRIYWNTSIADRCCASRVVITSCFGCFCFFLFRPKNRNIFRMVLHMTYWHLREIISSVSCFTRKSKNVKKASFLDVSSAPKCDVSKSLSRYCGSVPSISKWAAGFLESAAGDFKKIVWVERQEDAGCGTLRVVRFGGSPGSLFIATLWFVFFFFSTSPTLSCLTSVGPLSHS